MSPAPHGAELQIHFRGPLGWLSREDRPSVFDDPLGQRPGIYLWAVEARSGDLVFYVGKTSRSFLVRMTEHLKEYLSGMYEIYDISQFREGRKVRLWEGMWPRGAEVRYPEYLSMHDELWPHLLGMVRVMRFHLAAVEEGDERLLERVEAAIAGHLYQQTGMIGEFQNPDLRYRPRRSDEAPLMLRLRTDVPVLGLPSELQA